MLIDLQHFSANRVLYASWRVPSKPIRDTALRSAVLERVSEVGVLARERVICGTRGPMRERSPDTGGEIVRSRYGVNSSEIEWGPHDPVVSQQRPDQSSDIPRRAGRHGHPDPVIAEPDRPLVR